MGRGRVDPTPSTPTAQRSAKKGGRLVEEEKETERERQKRICFEREKG